MTEKQNTPEIRFEGFTDPWEQRKLGELFVESDERSSTEEILSVSVANGIYPASESERDTNPGASIANYKIVRVGDIVYNSMRMWQGAVGSSRYNGIVSPAYVVAKPVVELDSTCFGYLLKRPELLYKYLCNSQGNSKDTQTLRYERFAKITAEVPSTIEEQRAISDCLEGLDNLITLHQRKYDKLCTVKKSMLDKMFPKPGETEPEIRFEGFTDPWEQRKLGDIAPVTMGQSPNGACYTDNPNDAVLVQGNADLKDGWVFPRAWTTEITKTAKAGDLIMSVRAPVGAMGKTAYDVVLGRGVAGIAGNEFLFQALSKKEAEGYWSTVSAGSTFDSINGDELRNTLVDCPCSELECETIGDCLSKVDSLITLHQRKLELLRNIKKSLLDRMFV